MQLFARALSKMITVEDTASFKNDSRAIFSLAFSEVDFPQPNAMTLLENLLIFSQSTFILDNRENNLQTVSSLDCFM